MHTVGFVGTDLNKLSDLSRKFFVNVTESGVPRGKDATGKPIVQIIQRDQDHPPTIVCGVPMDKESQTINAFKLAYSLGAKKVIVTSDRMKQKEIDKIKQAIGDPQLQIIAMPAKSKSPDEHSKSKSGSKHFDFDVSDTDLSSPSAPEVKSGDMTSRSQDELNSVRSILPFSSRSGSSSVDATIREAYEQEEILNRAKEICYSDTENLHKINGGFADFSRWELPNTEEGRKLLEILTNWKTKQIVGVIGGAGVVTGFDFSVLLSKEKVYHIVLSASTARDKNHSVLKTNNSEETFIDQYNKVTQLLAIVAGYVAIPCNTAHIKLEEFAGEYLREGLKKHGRLIHIGEATLSKIKELYPENEKIILLATPATTTDPNSAYSVSKLLAAGFDRNSIIIPTPEQLSEIYTAIYEVKGFRSKEIISVFRKEERIPNVAIPDIEYSELRERARKRIKKVIKEMRREYGDIPVILGCTELPSVFSAEEMSKYGLMSSSGCLAQKCADVVYNRMPSPTLAPAIMPLSRDVSSYSVTSGSLTPLELHSRDTSSNASSGNSRRLSRISPESKTGSAAGNYLIIPESKSQDTLRNEGSTPVTFTMLSLDRSDNRSDYPSGNLLVPPELPMRESSTDYSSPTSPKVVSIKLPPKDILQELAKAFVTYPLDIGNSDVPSISSPEFSLSREATESDKTMSSVPNSPLNKYANSNEVGLLNLQINTGFNRTTSLPDLVDCTPVSTVSSPTPNEESGSRIEDKVGKLNISPQDVGIEIVMRPPSPTPSSPSATRSKEPVDKTVNCGGTSI